MLTNQNPTTPLLENTPIVGEIGQSSTTAMNSILGEKKKWWESWAYFSIRESLGLIEPAFFTSLAISKKLVLSHALLTTAVFSTLTLYFVLNMAEAIYNISRALCDDNVWKNTVNAYSKALLKTSLGVYSVALPLIISATVLSFAGVGFAPWFFISSLSLMSANSLINLYHCFKKWKEAVPNSKDEKFYKNQMIDHALNSVIPMLVILVLLGTFSLAPITGWLYVGLAITAVALMIVSRIKKTYDHRKAEQISHNSSTMYGGKTPTSSQGKDGSNKIEQESNNDEIKPLLPTNTNIKKSKNDITSIVPNETPETDTLDLPNISQTNGI